MLLGFAETWNEAWCRSVGKGSSWVPTACVAVLCFSASLQYTMVIGDSFSSIFKVGTHIHGVNAIAP